MKKIIKKNQIVITVLAVLIAIAGYLNYVDNNARETVKKLKEEETTTELNVIKDKDGEIKDKDGEIKDIGVSDIEVSDISDIDNKYIDNKANEGEEQKEKNIYEGDENKDILSNDTDINGNPGEAVIVSGSSNINFTISARLAREQVRASNRELMMNIINNKELTEAEKKQAVDQLVRITEVAERENAAEILLEAKGYSDNVVTITSEGVDVIIGGENLTDVQIAQIEDVVKRKAQVKADKITITTVSK